MLFLLFIGSLFFFFNDTATTEIYTLSLHDALPISRRSGSATRGSAARRPRRSARRRSGAPGRLKDRKSTRLNSSHSQISYAVFCLKKKKNRAFREIWELYINTHVSYML